MTSLGRAVMAFAALLVVFVITSCGTSQANGSVVKVDARSAVELIETGDHVVLDVRSPEAFAAGHVRGAVAGSFGMLAIAGAAVEGHE